MIRKPRFELTLETSNMAYPWFWKPKIHSVMLVPSIDVTVRWGYTRTTFKFWLD